MKKLDQFIVRSFLGPFVLTFLIVIFALMLQFLWLYIDELVGKGLSFLVILEFLGWGSATLIPLALPIATLLASIMTLGGMGEDNELLALKAAGISLQRVLLPLIFLSFAVSVGAFFASNNLIPVSYNKIYSLRDDISRTKDEIRIPTGIFYDGIEGYNIRIESRDESTGSIFDVMVYTHKENNGNTSLTLADSGSIKFTNDKKNLLFTLFDGYSYEEEPREYGTRDTSFTMQRIGFSRQEMIISIDGYSFKRSDEGRFSNEIMSQNLSQLKVAKDSLDSTYSKVKIYQYRNLISGGGLSFSRELDTAFNKNYISTIEYDSLFLWKDNHERLTNLNMASGQLESAITLLDNYQIEEMQYVFPLRKIRVERLRKFTLSIACFIFFFIGAPLGAIIRKGGLGTPVIVSMLFFVVYWVIDISGKKLATDGVIGPEIGTLISSMVLFPIGVYLTIKSTRDSSLFNAEAYIMFFNKLLKKINRYRGEKDDES
ncbi:MAG: LptF/LptG family permease [Bacteroidales bacterium]|nr:LptF/LptG family permease [Bacteroidales bacterium]